MNSLSTKQGVNKQPLVSICIPVYNSEKTIVSTVQSIINQTYKNLEIIIVDNVSTDHTLDLIEKITDPRLAVYRNRVNIGAENNFSKCIELATGEYIAIFHADDLYKLDMVQKQVKTFQENPSVGAVFTLASRINDQGKVIGEYKLPVELKNNGIYCFLEIFNLVLKKGNFLTCPSAMVKSKLYKELVPFNVEKYGTSADLDMWLRILKRCPIAILNEKLMSYRISNEQGSFISKCRIDEADFFKVIDFYLSVETDTVKDFINSSRGDYEFHRLTDNITRAVNYILKGQSQNSKKLLKEFVSNKAYKAALRSIREPKRLAFLIFGVTLLFSTYLRLEQYPSKMFHWLQFRKYYKHN